MPKPVILIPLSAVVPCDPGKSMQAYVALGVTTWQLIRHWFTWNNLIARYRRGLMDHEQFRNGLKKIFPILSTHTDDEIDDAWNRMCQYDEQSTAGFKAIQNLVTLGYQVYLFGSTNEKHIEFITSKFYGSHETLILPGKSIWSFDKKEGLIGNDFVTYLVNQIKGENSSAPIEIFFTQPIDPAPGLKGWFQHPYDKFMFKGAEKHVKQLHQSATKLGFQLIKCEHNNFAEVSKQYEIEPKEDFKYEKDATLVFRQKNTEKKGEKKSDEQPQLTSRRSKTCHIL